MSFLKKINNYLLSNRCIENIEYFFNLPPQDIANIYSFRAIYYANIAIINGKKSIIDIDNYNNYVIKIAKSAATDSKLYCDFIDKFIIRYFFLDTKKYILNEIKIESTNKAIEKSLNICNEIKRYVNEIIKEIDDLDINSLISKLYKELEEEWEIINK